MNWAGGIIVAIWIVLIADGTRACNEVTHDNVDTNSLKSVTFNVTGGNKSYIGCVNLKLDTRDNYKIEIRVDSQLKCSGIDSFTVIGDTTKIYFCARSPIPTIYTTSLNVNLRLNIYKSQMEQKVRVTYRASKSSGTTVQTGTCQRYRISVYDGRNTVKRYMSSSNYPGEYDPNTDKCYVLEASESRVRLEVTDFYLEKSPKCTKDYLEIRDGRFDTDPLLAKLCGSKSFQMFTSSGRSLFLRFKTDSTLQQKGYQLRYYRYKTDSPFNFLYGGIIIGVVFIIIICISVYRRRMWNRQRTALRSNMTPVQSPTIINPNTGMPYATPGGAPQGNVNMAYTPGVGVNMQNQYGFAPQYGGYAAPPAGGPPAEGVLPPSYDTIYSTTDQPGSNKS